MGEKGCSKKLKTSEVNVVDATFEGFVVPNGKTLNYVLEYFEELISTGGIPSGIFVRLDGTTPLDNDWDAGSHVITSHTFHSTIDSVFNTVPVGLGSGSVSDNTRAGIDTLNFNSEGYGNSAFGYNSLRANTEGFYNSSIGSYAMELNTIGAFNTALGTAALNSNTEGSNNTSIGFVSLVNNTTGGQNTAVGYAALESNSTGTYNEAIGYSALSTNTTGTQNTAIGSNSLLSNTTGEGNVAMGFQALSSNTTGYSNVAAGIKALNSTTTGNSNVGVGDSSLFSNTIGSQNVSIGLNSLANNIEGSNNVAIGADSLSALLYTNDNIAIGHGAGELIANGLDGNTDASHSVFIGSQSKPLNANDDNQIVIGYNVSGNGGNTTTIGNPNSTGDAYMHGNHHIGEERSIIFHLGGELGYINLPSIGGTRNWNLPDQSGTFAMLSDISAGSVTSVGLSMPSAFTVSSSPITSSGDISVTAAGLSTQYVRGDGQLANFPTSLGGGSSVNIYANGGTSQGTFDGNTYYQLSPTADTGASVDFTLNTGSPSVRFITDANYPDEITIPQGSWVFRTYLNQNNNSGNCTIQVKLYKWDGASFTLLSTGQLETITGGTTLDLYTHALTIPSGITLSTTDRLAVEYTGGNFGGARSITLHTQDANLAQIQTTYSTGLNTINGLTDQVQYFSVGNSGSDFGISSSIDTHTFNIPTASATNRGALSTTDWSMFNGKEGAITAGTTSQYWRGDKSWQTLDKTAVGLSNVENIALSTWAGSANITTLGTISTGVWHGTAIGDTYISSAAIWNAKQAALSGTGFVKISGTTISYDNSTYITGNQTVTLSGDVTGSGATSITASIAASTVTGKLITGFVSGAGTVGATDTILQAINKLDGNIGGKQATLVNTTNIKSVNGTTLLGPGNLAVGDALVANSLSQFAATTSAQLAGVISDETGSGALVFGTSPTLSNPVVGTQTPGDNSTKAASTAFVEAAITAAGSGLTANQTLLLNIYFANNF